MILPVVKRKAQEYQTERGKAPFRDWLLNLKSAQNH